MDKKQNLYSEIINKKILEHIPKLLGGKKSAIIIRRGKITEEEAKEIASMKEAPSELLGLIAKLSDLADMHAIRHSLVFNPKTPVAVSKSLIAYLDKSELVKIIGNFNVPYSLKNIVLEYLKHRLPEIPAGEKISLARKAPRKILQLILYDDDEMVFEASLWNPKLIETDLLVYLQKKTDNSALLSLIAGHPKWKNRYPVKKALVRNPATPFSISADIIPKLLLQDLRVIKSAPRLNEKVYELIEESIVEKKRKKSLTKHS